MAKETGVIPVSDARELGKKRKCPLIVVFAIEEDVTRFTVTTWGRNRELCQVAASFGEQIRQAVFGGEVVPPDTPDGLTPEPSVTAYVAAPPAEGGEKE